MAAPATALAGEASPATWWHTSDLIDYALIAGGVGLYAGVHAMEVPAGAGIGPSFDPAKPAAILDPSLSDRIGRRHLTEGSGETVPTERVAVAIPIVLTWLTLQEALPGLLDGAAPAPHVSRARLVHDTAVGFAEAMAFTAGATEVLKFSFGRLRPDFQDRVRRHYCATGGLSGAECPPGLGGPLDADPERAAKILTDGRRSFPSGHASTSFAMATYASLVTGGHFVWGERAGGASRGLGVLVQTAAMATATFVAGSRIDDGRHHASDVLTGAALGFGFGNLSYWRRFGSNGLPRARTTDGRVTWDLGPGPGDFGLSLSGTFGGARQVPVPIGLASQ